MEVKGLGRMAAFWLADSSSCWLRPTTHISCEVDAMDGPGMPAVGRSVPTTGLGPD